MYIKFIAETKLPTPWGDFLLVGFEEIFTGYNHIALIYGDVKFFSSILVRIHSECLTGDTFFSLRCDCGFQLEASLTYIVKNKCGILFYHRQEGRNIGILNKIRAYSFQDIGVDTVEANYKLGFLKDERDFSLCFFVFNILGIKKIILLTNNPEKVKILIRSGVNIIEIIPLVLGKNFNNLYYLSSKINKMGHVFK
ncbi:MAG: GTP cyclohydrolase II [gamma proteobacterium endosymbiont of Trioza apicalis]